MRAMFTSHDGDVVERLFTMNRLPSRNRGARGAMREKSARPKVRCRAQQARIDVARHMMLRRSRTSDVARHATARAMSERYAWRARV